jgi:hypothetical protein
MSDHSDRAHRIVLEFQEHCEKVEIVSIEPHHYQFRVWRKASRPLSTLFGNDESRIHTFDYWCADQTVIEWSSVTKSRFWIGYLADKTKVTIIVEK